MSTNSTPTDAYNGLSPDEDRILDDLVNAYNKFAALERQHPNELLEFAAGIHQLQGLLSLRVVRRDYPEGYHEFSQRRSRWL